MKLSVPTNFDDRLLDGLSGFDAVEEVYGKVTADELGGGKPSMILPQVDFRKLRRWVNRLHPKGIRFNYLLNAASLDAIETTAAGYRSIRSILDNLCDAGVDGITISNPLLLQIAKRHYPQLSVKVSAFAGVATPQGARFWANMGADVITAAPTLVNRNFDILQGMAETVDGSARIQVVANNNCLLSCPFYNTHANLVSHTSQSGHWTQGYIVDYCLFNCRLVRLMDPSHYLKGDWIRPEDMTRYESIGIHTFKLVTRTTPTDLLLERIKAYSQRRWDGNLLELVEHARDYRQESRMTTARKLKMARAFVRPRLSNPLRVKTLSNLILPLNPFIYIDNRALDGFLDRFVHANCSHTNCRDCNYCDQIAEKVTTVDGEPFRDYQERYRDALQKFLDGYFFEWK